MPSDPVKVGIFGACGRMGQRLVALGSADPGIDLVATLESPQHAQLGSDAGQMAGAGTLDLPITSEWSAGNTPQVVIDFSTPEGSLELLPRCVEGGVALVLATTGFDDAQRATIAQAAESIPLVWAPNMSLAVNLAMKLAEDAAEVLAQSANDVDVEIIERHHRFKEDAPSGTALHFGERIAKQLDRPQQAHGRSGRPGQRPVSEIGYHAVRAGDHPGEHRIIFGLLGETIEVHVSATSRDSYALGAFAAAKWIVGKPAGLYGMNDVLGL